MLTRRSLVGGFGLCGIPENLILVPSPSRSLAFFSPLEGASRQRREGSDSSEQQLRSRRLRTRHSPPDPPGTQFYRIEKATECVA